MCCHYTLVKGYYVPAQKLVATTDTSFAFLFGREQTNLGPSVRDRNKTHTQLELLSYFQIIRSKEEQGQHEDSTFFLYKILRI